MTTLKYINVFGRILRAWTRADISVWLKHTSQQAAVLVGFVSYLYFNLFCRLGGGRAIFEPKLLKVVFLVLPIDRAGIC